ncbi:MAG: SAM-dependent methyltransferase [Candidatus Acidiferrales bacterium]|jgi:methyltransferase (TIGR00027 family)
MSTASSIIRDISDTARWAAVFRAQEDQRADALFRDPFAMRLAGPRGFEIAGTLSNQGHRACWVLRTYLFDQMIARAMLTGVDTVINLGAGLDARPYRMGLPRSLHWVEVDRPEILDYKEEMLASEKPLCSLERIGLDLLNREQRLAFFRQMNRRSKRILIVCEGVLIYFRPEEAAALASELAGQCHFEHWIFEVVSPGVLDTMNRTAARHLGQTGISFQFGPSEGPAFFERYGWKLAEAQSVLKTAIRLGRTPIDPGAHTLMPDVPPAGENSLPWVGVCLLHSLFNSQRRLPSRRSDSQHRERSGSGDGQIRHQFSCANS